MDCAVGAVVGAVVGAAVEHQQPVFCFSAVWWLLMIYKIDPREFDCITPPVVTTSKCIFDYRLHPSPRLMGTSPFGPWAHEFAGPRVLGPMSTRAPRPTHNIMTYPLHMSVQSTTKSEAIKS